MVFDPLLSFIYNSKPKLGMPLRIVKESPFLYPSYFGVMQFMNRPYEVCCLCPKKY